MQLRSRAGLLALFVSLGCATGTGVRVSADEAEAWTLPRAIAEALRTHPLVRAAEARVRNSRSRLGGARALPSTSVTLQHGVGNGTGGLDEDIAITQPFELGAKRNARVQQAQAELRREEAGVLAARAQVAFDVAGAYVDLEEAEREVEQTRAFVNNAEAFRKAAQDQFTAGEVPKTQVIRSDIEVAARRQTLDEAEERRDNRRALLNRLAGQAPDRPIAIAAVSPAPAPGPLSRWQTLIADQPELQSARAELAARQAALKTANAERLPDFFVAGMHGDVTSAQGNSVRAGLTFPLFDRSIRRAKRGEAQAAIDEQIALLEDARKSAEVEVDTAYRSTERSLARLARYTYGQLEQTRNLTELARIGYEAGQTSYLEVLDAQRAQFEAETGYLHALAESRRAWLSLLKAAAAPELLTDPFAAPIGGPK